MDSNDPNSFYNLSPSDARSIFGSDTDTNTPTTSGTANSSNWFNSLAGLANAGASAYRTASGKPATPKPTSSLLPLIAGVVGLIGLVFVIVLVSRK